MDANRLIAVKNKSDPRHTWTSQFCSYFMNASPTKYNSSISRFDFYVEMCYAGDRLFFIFSNGCAFGLNRAGPSNHFVRWVCKCLL